MFASAFQSKQEQNDIKVVGKGRNNPNETISADLAIIKRGWAEYSSQPQANKRRAESKVKSLHTAVDSVHNVHLIVW